MTDIASLTVYVVALDELIEDPENANKHDDDSLAMIRSSLDAFGQQKPIVVAQDGRTVIAGNGQLAAARSLGWSGIQVVKTDLTLEAARAYAIADNRSAEGARWDDDVLGSQLAAILEADSDLFLATGFDEDDLCSLLGRSTREGRTAPDAVPAVPDAAVSTVGSAYALGAHRLSCGDARNYDAVALACDVGEVMLLLTDPPYNVDYAATQVAERRRSKVREADGTTEIAHDAMTPDDYLLMLEVAFGHAKDQMTAGAAFYIWHASMNAEVEAAVSAAGLSFRSCLVWVKPQLVMGRQDYHWRHELCLYGWKGGKAHAWYGDRKQSTVLEFDRPDRSDDHPTMKPVDLWEYLIGNSSARGDIVLDLFAGSGTTAIACERMGRRAAMVEIDPRYCDVIRRRWAEYVHGEGCDWQEHTPEIP